MWRHIERIAIVEIGARLVLCAALIANGYKAQEVLAHWMPGWVAWVLAGAIEGALLVITYIIADRRVYNANKLKSAPEADVDTLLWSAFAFFSALSAVANFEALRFHGAGLFAFPFGLAAPAIAAFVAYVLANEASTAQRITEYKANEKQRKAQAKQTRAERKQAQAKQEQLESEKPHVCKHCEQRFSSAKALSGHGVARCGRKQAAKSNGSGMQTQEEKANE